MTVLNINSNGTPPTKGQHGDAAYDLRSAQQRVIQPGQSQLILTHFHMELPEGYAALVCSRSGLALKESVAVLNAPGIVDPNYGGDIGVILHNFGSTPFTVEKGDRVAQLLFVQTFDAAFEHKAIVTPIGDRGNAGFGSTGVK